MLRSDRRIIQPGIRGHVRRNLIHDTFSGKQHPLQAQRLCDFSEDFPIGFGLAGFCDKIKLGDKLDVVFEIIIKQLLRSATSILANYIEAASASSRRDFINFFTYSLKSANESKVWLTLLRDLNVGDQQELCWLLEELVEISKIFATSIITLKGKKKF